MSNERTGCSLHLICSAGSRNTPHSPIRLQYLKHIMNININGLVTVCTDRTVTTWQYLRAHCTADPVVHKMAAEVTATSGSYCQMAGRCLVIIYCITSYYYSTSNGQLQFVISAEEKLSIPFLLQYLCNIQATPTIMYCTVK